MQILACLLLHAFLLQGIQINGLGSKSIFSMILTEIKLFLLVSSLNATSNWQPYQSDEDQAQHFKNLNHIHCPSTTEIILCCLLRPLSPEVLSSPV